jgi:glucose/arabinose dehydrogenase
MQLMSNLLIAALIFVAACKENKELVDTTQSQSPTVSTTTIVNNREVIWGMDFLPDGDMLFTEKRGRLVRVNKTTNALTELTGLPGDIDASGQGGLMDIKVHPNYTANGWIYVNYSSTGGFLNLIRFKLNGNQVGNIETLLKTNTASTWRGHYGGRIVFDQAGFLYLSVGEGGTTSYGGENSPNKNAQNLSSPWGKIHRMTDDGKVPADNPVFPGTSAASTIWAYGVRNPQGLVYNPLTGQLWETEHGPMGGDELNLIQKGNNYGWPLVSYGRNYDGVAVSASPLRDGITAPVTYWVPSIAACGLIVVTNPKFKRWYGNLLSGALAGAHVHRIMLQDGKVVETERLWNGLGRIRNIKEGPDGNIYLSVEGPGRIIRVSPAN